MKMRNKKVCAAFTLLLVASAVGMSLSGCGKKELTLQEILAQTAEYELKALPNPDYGTLLGDWTVLALARSNEELPESYEEIYLANLEKAVKEKKGVLSDRKYTEYSRICLVLQALGKDASDFGGYDLMEPLLDVETVEEQGINGAVYALLALQADGEENAQTKKEYLESILEQEKSDGGFSMDEQASEGDADMTAMVLQCLALYQDQGEAEEAVKRGVNCLAELLGEDGTYTSYGEASSESLSQVILALSACGVDCNSDSRFVKEEKGLYDRLLEYRQKDGGFSHTPEGESDQMATDQAFCALAAYQRFLDGKNTFYDMTDHR